MIVPSELVFIISPVMNDFAIVLPRSSQQQVAYVHCRYIAIYAIFVMRTYRERDQGPLSNPDCGTFMQPTESVG